MNSNTNVEVRTRSIPTAAALICQGFEPTRVIYRDHGGSQIVFAPESRAALDRFLAMKQRIEGMLEDADGLR